MPTQRGGWYYTDRVIPIVGRICMSLQTKLKEVGVAREQVILRLAATENYEPLFALRDRRITIAELSYAYQQGPGEVRRLLEKKSDPKISDVLPAFIRDKNTEISSADRYERSLKALMSWMPKGARVSWIAKADRINEWKRLRLEKGLSTATVSRDLAAIHQLLHWQDPVLVRTVFANVKWPKKPPRRTRRLTVGEIQKLLAEGWAAQSVGGVEYYDIYIAMLVTGMRPSEITRLQTEDIDLDRLVVSVPLSKTTQGVRELPLPYDDAIISMFRKHKDRALGRGVPVFSVKQETLSDTFRRHAKRAGIEKVQLRDLRRTHLQYCRLAEKDIVEVRDQAGHTTVRHTEFYAGASSVEERRGMVNAALDLMFSTKEGDHA